MNYTKYVTLSKGEISRFFSFMYDKYMDDGWKCEEMMYALKMLLISNDEERNDILEDMGESLDFLMTGVDR